MTPADNDKCEACECPVADLGAHCHPPHAHTYGPGCRAERTPLKPREAERIAPYLLSGEPVPGRAQEKQQEPAGGWSHPERGTHGHAPECPTFAPGCPCPASVPAAQAKPAPCDRPSHWNAAGECAYQAMKREATPVPVTIPPANEGQQPEIPRAESEAAAAKAECSDLHDVLRRLRLDSERQREKLDTLIVRTHKQRVELAAARAEVERLEEGRIATVEENRYLRVKAGLPEPLPDLPPLLTQALRLLREALNTSHDATWPVVWWRDWLARVGTFLAQKP